MNQLPYWVETKYRSPNASAHSHVLQKRKRAVLAERRMPSGS